MNFAIVRDDDGVFFKGIMVWNCVVEFAILAGSLEAYFDGDISSRKFRRLQPAVPTKAQDSAE